MTDREFLVLLLSSGIQLSGEKLTMLFQLENATELVKAYVKRNAFPAWSNDVLLLFNRADSPELVLFYVQQGYGFMPDVEYKLFELPNAEEILTIYVARHRLHSNLAQLKLFAFPNAPEILKLYIGKRHELNPQAQLKLFDLPNAEELVRRYIALNFNFSKEFRRLARKKGWYKG